MIVVGDVQIKLDSFKFVSKKLLQRKYSSEREKQKQLKNKI